MHKRFDNIFSALMLAAAVVVVPAGTWVLSRSIERAGECPPPEHIVVGIADAPQRLRAEPLPTPTPIPEPDYSYIPLDKPLVDALVAACEENDVPLPLALGLIEVESRFQVDAVSAEGCYGLCQIHPGYFPAGLSPADNIRYGIGYLGELLDRYGDTAAALVSYNQGSYKGTVTQYAKNVLEASEEWENSINARG